MTTIVNNTYSIFVGLDISKNKADAAIMSVCRDRSIKPKFLRKKLSFNFFKDEVDKFLSTVREFASSDCTSITFAMEITGVYSERIFEYIHDHLNANENVYFLNTQFVNDWREAHHYAKSDPLDAMTITKIIGTDDDVKFVTSPFEDNQKGYNDLKALIHRYYQIKSNYTQEINRLTTTCDCYFPELSMVFPSSSAAFLAILSVYPTTYDIINADINEVFSLVSNATKKRTDYSKIEKLYSLCSQTLLSKEPSQIKKDIIISSVESVSDLKSDMCALEKDIKALASEFELFPILMSMPGCGVITAASVIAETGDISRFKNADHYLSYMGIVPDVKRSGSSVHTVGKITKRGSRILRHSVFMIAEFARRHNPVLKYYFDRVKGGNKKRHKLAVVAVANKIGKYIYSMMKKESTFVILHEHLMKLPEDTRNSFFESIELNYSDKTRKQVYRYSDEYVEIHSFVYKSKQNSEILA